MLMVILMGGQMAHAQEKPVLLAESIGGSLLGLNKANWRFSPGDSAAFANPGYNDSAWRSTATRFGETDQPAGWAGIGWFRIWLKKETVTDGDNWGLKLNHDGASEIYLDGKLVGNIGTVGRSKELMTPARAPFIAVPLVMADTLPHLLAIRYSNHNRFFPGFTGFQVWVNDLQTVTRQLANAKTRNEALLLSVTAQLTLVMLHLFLFLFYPAQKLNLWYSLFVGSSAIALFFKFLEVAATDPYWQLVASNAFVPAVTCSIPTGAALLYGIAMGYLPKRKMIVICSLAALIIVFSLITWGRFGEVTDGITWYSCNLLLAFTMIDGLRRIITAIRNRKPGSWLIAGGMLGSGILTILVGGNVFGWFESYAVIISTMAISTLIMPVIFSIYLAMDFARINKNLSHELLANQRLAADNLAAEKEKNRLIAEQAELLEKTVFERTAEVRQQADRLREMDELKSRFFVNLTHEFRTPLTLILNPARELLRQSDTVAARQYASFIISNSERLLKLINQLLDLSKLESREMPVVKENIELVDWLRTHIQQYVSPGDPQQASIKFSTSLSSFNIHTDIDKVEKIVQNLLSNALKFSNGGDVITVQLTQGNGFFELRVSDTGSGIPAAKLPYIFDRFYQVDASDTRSREGTGIGLALTRELVLLLGGEISASSMEGEGTVFTVQLPYEKAVTGRLNTSGAGSHEAKELTASGASLVVVEISPTSPVSAIAAEPARKGSGLTLQNDQPDQPLILLIEDNEDLRQFISLSISGEYKTIAAPDGEAGIVQAFELVPDLVITDLMMPKKDGYQVCEALKTDERTSHIPVIMLTAKTTRESRIRGIETGADAYLAKPFDRTELLAVIANLINMRARLREKFGRDNVWLSDAASLPSIDKNFLDRVRAAVEHHLDDSAFGADQLGREIGLSRTQLHRKLKEIINQSPGELLRTIRMQRAHELLQNNVFTVSEVGYQVGYGNPANFSTAFSKHFGYPPSGLPKSPRLP